MFIIWPSLEALFINVISDLPISWTQEPQVTQQAKKMEAAKSVAETTVDSARTLVTTTADKARTVVTSTVDTAKTLVNSQIGGKAKTLMKINSKLADAAKALVNSKITDNVVMVFSKTICPYCNMAKDVIRKYINTGEIALVDLDILEIDDREDCEAIQSYLQTITGSKTVCIKVF